MQTTIDSAGRLVVPKPLRDAIGLVPGRRVDIVFVDGRLEIEVAPLDAHLEMKDGFPVIVPDEPVPPLSEDEVRRALDAVRL
jgi:AbrB family looped-hinge helix DNA binding protein